MPTVQEVWQDPDFHKLPPTEKAKVMQAIDSDFAALPTGEQNKVVFQLSNRNMPAQQTVTGNINASPAETERMRREFVAHEGTIGTRAKDALNTAFNPDVSIPAADSATDFAGRVLPQSITQLGPKMFKGVYEGIKGQTDPLVKSLSSLQPQGLPGPQMERNAGQTLRGLAEATTAPTGLMGVERAKEAWLTDPAGSALAVAPTLKALKSGAVAAKSGLGVLSESRSIPNAAKLTAQIDEGFTKAVRPSVENTRTATQAANYKANARNAVKEIVLNKDNLNLADADGNPVQGLPRNLEQFRQSIDSTKRQIWKQVEEVNNAAGQSGIGIPLQSAAQELQNLAINPVYTTMEPGTVAYAKQKALALSKQGSFSIADAQDAITVANQSLKNFYRNPSADTASRAYVDSLVANHLRAGLDAAIEQATGSSAAGPLRKAYGSLKAIEKDVNQRATVDARKNSRGLIDFTDVFTAGELAKALTSFSPEGLAKAGAMAAVKSFIKRMNDPSTHVRRVFGAADKLVSKTEYVPPKGAPMPPKDIPRPPWENKVNTGGLTQPGPTVNSMGPVNTGEIRQPGPIINEIGPVNTGVPARLSAQPNQMQGVNGGNLNAPAREQLSTNLLKSSPVEQQSIAAPATWREFVKANMGQYMKEEGSHGAAMKRLAKEWKSRK